MCSMGAGSGGLIALCLSRAKEASLGCGLDITNITDSSTYKRRIIRVQELDRGGSGQMGPACFRIPQESGLYTRVSKAQAHFSLCTFVVGSCDETQLVVSCISKS